MQLQESSVTSKEHTHTYTHMYKQWRAAQKSECNARSITGRACLNRKVYENGCRDKWASSILKERANMECDFEDPEARWHHQQEKGFFLI